MAFAISREQQKVFVEQFMSQVLDVAIGLVDQGKDQDSPGAMIHAIGVAVIRQLKAMEDV